MDVFINCSNLFKLNAIELTVDLLKKKKKKEHRNMQLIASIFCGKNVVTDFNDSMNLNRKIFDKDYG